MITDPNIHGIHFTYNKYIYTLIHVYTYLTNPWTAKYFFKVLNCYQNIIFDWHLHC